jgi:hypothetical protein
VAEQVTRPALPGWAAPLLGEGSVWCDEAGDYIDIHDPSRVVLRPLGDAPGPCA